MSATAESLIDNLEPIDRKSIEVIVELPTAVLCLDCEAIYGATQTTCPRCGSVHRFPVARVIRPILVAS